ncbi:hypothetical protein K7432_017619 [Basidiobolus ranarum]|uniref:Transcription and mRNA export factor SUS1 n=1 Tax=Basidiobolus ranarum TaxID=34480 RepID=A0ABR2VKX6_9FUNG
MAGNTDEEKIRMSLCQKFTESGEKDRLQSILQERLRECGWLESIKAHCSEIVKEKLKTDGVTGVTVNEMVSQITPHARGTVPEDIKADMLLRIKKYLEESIPN